MVTLFVSSGCGYHVAGMGAGELPGRVKRVSIPFFINETKRPNVENVITTAIADEFSRTVSIVEREKSEAVMLGTIRSYDLIPVSFTATDVIQEYRLSIKMSVRLVSTSDGSVLWEDDNITDYDDFRVNTTDVTATKEAEWEALIKMSKDTARLIKERMLEGF